MILVEAVGREPRPGIDYRLLNSSIRNQYFPLPNIEERVERVSSAKFITVIDLAKGYWQIPLSKRAQRYATFVTNFGTYVPLRMPFGNLEGELLVNREYDYPVELKEGGAPPLEVVDENRTWDGEREEGGEPN
ncbi:hypothetical protein AVEN_260407-1 [Araneus ventricosus]|uniref:Reverse transcriptase domain-containing protein n=1 Tax=Araneus ventricosus TaxID=182803 RepID=A0A4Y2KKS9_ARAVE|nr:hypothetical protein AVEN_260407-1 [Araneus ventricosus]